MIKTAAAIFASKNLRNVYLPWFLLVVFYMYQYIFRIYPNHLEEQIKLTFNATAASFGSIGALYLLAYSLFQIPLGIIVDRVGVKKVVLYSIMLCILSVLLFRTTEIFVLAQVSRFMMGLGSGSAFMCALKVIADHFPPGKRGLLMGMTLTLGTISPFLTGSLISYIAFYYNWKSVMDLLALSGLILFLAILLFMHNKGKTVYQKNNISTIPEVLRNVAKLMVNPYIIIYSLIAVGLYTPLSALADVWGISFIRQKFGINPVVAGSISDLLFLGLASGSLLIPWYCEKKKIINKALFLCLLILLILFSIMIYVDISVSMLVVCIVFIGFFSGAEMMCFTGALQVFNNHNSGEVIGIVNTLNMLGGAFIQWVIGVILDYTWDGSYQANGLRFYSDASYKYALTSVIIMISVCTLSSLALKRFRVKTNTL